MKQKIRKHIVGSEEQGVGSAEASLQRPSAGTPLQPSSAPPSESEAAGLHRVAGAMFVGFLLPM